MNTENITMNKLEQVAVFVRSHGFAATVLTDSVMILIPYVAADGSKGFEEGHARTLKEARNALGY